MVLLTRQLSNLDKIFTCYNNWRLYITGQIWKISTRARAWVHYTVYLEQSLPVAKGHLEMGFPPASQQCAAYIPRVPKEINCALCRMPAKIDALMLHTSIWGISREHKNTSHFQKKTFDLTLDEVGCWRGTSMEKCRSMWKAAICSGAIKRGWGWGTNYFKIQINCSKGNKLSGEVFLYIQKYHQRWR